MDEQTWMSSVSLGEMVEHLRSLNAHRKKVGRRKFRLYSCACARRIWDRLDAPAHALIETVEQFLDGRLTKADVERQYQELLGHHRTIHLHTHSYGVVWAAAGNHYPEFMALQAAGTVVSALVIEARNERQQAGGGVQELNEASERVSEREKGQQTDLLREIFGNPFRPLPKQQWSADIRGLALACYEDASNYPMLADALEDANESEAAEHCRQPGHVKGCHVVDWILGRA